MALVQVTPDGDSWQVQLDGSPQGGAYSTQAEAVNTGREVAKANRAEFQLHGEDGSIREKDSYGSDPRDIPG